jgi:hypothetical protein
MFALIAAIILFLHGVGVLDNGDDVNWWVVGVAFIALHLAWIIPLPAWGPRRQ